LTLYFPIAGNKIGYGVSFSFGFFIGVGGLVEERKVLKLNRIKIYFRNSTLDLVRCNLTANKW
jgi:hypothetical protein